MYTCASINNPSPHLILLEKRSTDVLIEIVSECLAKKAKPSLEYVALIRSFDRQHIEIDEPAERVLIHGVDVGQVRHCVIQRRAVLGYGTIALTESLDFRLGFLCRLLLAHYVAREEFRRVQYLNGFLVLEDTGTRD